MCTNYPVNIADVSAAEEIFGLDEGILQIKTVRTNPPEVKSVHVNIPMELIARYQSVILSADYIFVNGAPFFNTYSRDIKFTTSQQQETNTYLMIRAMKSIKAYYVKRGFKIAELRADQQFEPAQVALADIRIELNASIRNEHIP